MRYKVRTKSDDDYGVVRRELQERHVNVVLEVPRRHLLAIDEDVSDELAGRIADLGAELVPDAQYELDSTG